MNIQVQGDEAAHDGSKRGAGSPRRRWFALAIGLAVIPLVAAACSSSPPSSSTSTTSSTAAPTGLSSATVRTLQTQLASVGCYTGAIDGVIGPATTQALKSFQSASGLTVDGVYGSNTKAKLSSAASAGSKVCSSASTTTTSSTTGTSGVPSGATAAITAYEAANGPKAGTWMVTSTAASTVDPSYVLFHIGPAPGYESTVQGGYGFVHGSGDTWMVIGFGSSEVGCPPGATGNQVVPTNVLTGFGLSCPPS
jgi:peptidoglycan hydrolase-like protein with peptidoglycan-binding domain